MVDEYGKEIDFDLLTRTRYRLYQLGGELDWTTLWVFVQGLGVDSALYAAQHPERFAWDSGIATPWLIADLIDEIRYLRYEHAASKSRTRPRQPERYPRPGDRKGNIIGSDPIPVSQFREWWESH